MFAHDKALLQSSLISLSQSINGLQYHLQLYVDSVVDLMTLS